MIRVHPKTKGFTLIELLIVLAISVTIAAVVLPTVKTLLKDRKANQAAIQFRSFLDLARARAIATGKPVAVMLERSQPLAVAGVTNPGGTPAEWSAAIARSNFVQRMSLAEVLPAYKGDLPSSTATLSDESVTTTMTLPLSAFDRASDFFVLPTSQNPTADFNIQPGDTVAFGNSPVQYRILGKTYDAVNDLLEVRFENPPYVPRLDTNYVGPPRNGSVGDRPKIDLPYGSPLAFRVFPKPRRLFARPLSLPSGTCIDLSVSGIGIDGYQFSAKTIKGVGTDPPASVRMQPIYIVFTPTGHVSSVIMNNYQLPTMDQFIAHSDLYFLVGRTDQVTDYDDDDPNTLDMGGIGLSTEIGASVDDPFRSNLYDSNNYWVRIAANTGGITTSVNVDAENTRVNPPPTLPPVTSFGMLLGRVRGNSLSGEEATAQ